MILHKYFAIKFMWSFLGVFALFELLLAMIDFIEEMRKPTNMPFGEMLEIVLLNAPAANYQILPLVVILASVAFFLRLSRTNEMVVVRASGRSAFRILSAPVAMAGLIGVIAITMFNPIMVAATKLHIDMVNEHFGRSSNVLMVTSDGIWLRQGNERGQTVIHALRAKPENGQFFDATFFTFSSEGEPLRRIAAKTATLGPQDWILEDVKSWNLSARSNPESAALKTESLTLPTTITLDSIADSFSKPELISFWELPDFIEQYKKAGFSARQYKAWYQSELSRPLFLIAIVLIAASFTIHNARFGHAGLSALIAVMIGFGMHYVRNLALVQGETGQIPIALAVWTPAIASLLFAIGVLIHLEYR